MAFKTEGEIEEYLETLLRPLNRDVQITLKNREAIAPLKIKCYFVVEVNIFKKSAEEVIDLLAKELATKGCGLFVASEIGLNKKKNIPQDSIVVYVERNI